MENYDYLGKAVCYFSIKNDEGKNVPVIHIQTQPQQYMNKMIADRETANKKTLAMLKNPELLESHFSDSPF